MITNLGGGVFRLVRRYSVEPNAPREPGIRIKTPPNQAGVLFMRRGDNIIVLRGSLMISVAELKKELGAWK